MAGLRPQESPRPWTAPIRTTVQIHMRHVRPPGAAPRGRIAAARGRHLESCDAISRAEAPKAASPPPAAAGGYAALRRPDLGQCGAGGARYAKGFPVGHALAEIPGAVACAAPAIARGAYSRAVLSMVRICL